MARVPIVHEIDLTEIDEEDEASPSSHQGLSQHQHHQPPPPPPPQGPSSSLLRSNNAASKRPVCDIDLAMASSDDSDDDDGVEGDARPQWTTAAADERGASERGGSAQAPPPLPPQAAARRPDKRPRLSAPPVMAPEQQQQSHHHHQGNEAQYSPAAHHHHDPSDPTGAPPSVPSLTGSPGLASSQRPPRPHPLREDEDLRIIGSHHQQAAARAWDRDLPHNRHLCNSHLFSRRVSASNSRMCPQCCCYICDVPASECREWGDGLSTTDHCNAHCGDGLYVGIASRRRGSPQALPGGAPHGGCGPAGGGGGGPAPLFSVPDGAPPGVSPDMIDFNELQQMSARAAAVAAAAPPLRGHPPPLPPEPPLPPQGRSRGDGGSRGPRDPPGFPFAFWAQREDCQQTSEEYSEAEYDLNDPYGLLPGPPGGAYGGMVFPGSGSGHPQSHRRSGGGGGGAGGGGAAAGEGSPAGAANASGSGIFKLVELAAPDDRMVELGTVRLRVKAKGGNTIQSLSARLLRCGAFNDDDVERLLRREFNASADSGGGGGGGGSCGDNKDLHIGNIFRQHLELLPLDVALPEVPPQRTIAVTVINCDGTFWPTSYGIEIRSPTASLQEVAQEAERRSLLGPRPPGGYLTGRFLGLTPASNSLMPASSPSSAAQQQPESQQQPGSSAAAAASASAASPRTEFHVSNNGTTLNVRDSDIEGTSRIVIWSPVVPLQCRSSIQALDNSATAGSPGGAGGGSMGGAAGGTIGGNSSSSPAGGGSSMRQLGRIVVLHRLILPPDSQAPDARRKTEPIGFPTVLNVCRSVIKGGKRADVTVRNAILDAMLPFQRPGSTRPEASDYHTLRSLRRCNSRGDPLIERAPNGSRSYVSFSSAREPNSHHSGGSDRTVFVLARWPAEHVERLFDLLSWRKEASDPGSEPVALVASRERHRAARELRKAKEQARAGPRAVVEELSSAQLCSKPTGLNYQAHVPWARVLLDLEPSIAGASSEGSTGGSSKTGVASFRVFVWTSPSPAPPPRPRAMGGSQSLQSHAAAPVRHTQFFQEPSAAASLRSVLRMLAADNAGAMAAEEALDAWKARLNAQRTVSTPELLRMLETNDVEPAPQPPGLTVTLRPYQLQTLRFLQRCETYEGGLCQQLWFKVPMPGGGRFWWSPGLREVLLTKPPPAAWGGFLAETMGLGKTIEILALVLSDRGRQPPVAARASTLYVEGDPERTRGNPSQSQQQQASGAATASVQAGASTSSAALPKDSAEVHNGRLCSNATLVVCAVSLVGQWVAEANEKTGGSLRIYQYHGQNRTRDIRKLATEYDLVVTTYGTMGKDWGRMLVHRTRTDSNSSNRTGRDGCDPQYKISPMHGIHWYRLVLDESHFVKSANSLQTKAAADIEATRRWCASGTPFATELSDLHGQFVALKMPPFADKGFFNTRVRNFPNAMTSCREDGVVLLAALSRIMVRHTKDQVTGGETVLHLPPLQVEEVEVEIGPAEAELYRSLHTKAAAAFRGYATRGPACTSKNLLRIMTLLLPLRRIASGGSLSQRDLTLPESGPYHGPNGGPRNPVPEVPGLHPPDDMQCAICLDTPEGPVATPCNHWFCHECLVSAFQAAPASRCPLCRAAVSEQQLRAPERPRPPESEDGAGGSGEDGLGDVLCESKLKALVAELYAMRSRDSSAKALVFSQYMGTIEWLKARLPLEGFGIRTINGSMPLKQRAKAIEDFQADPPTTVFLLSMRAGAVGINLTAASHVFLLEPALNPALEEQAIGRAWRMGQKRPVVVKKLYVKGSVEESIMEVVRRRQGPAALAPSAAAASATPSQARQLLQPGALHAIARRGAEQELAGHIQADRQNLKLAELELLFSEPKLTVREDAATAVAPSPGSAAQQQEQEP